MIILHLQTELNFSCGITRYIQSLHRSHSRGNKIIILCFGGDAVDAFREQGIEVRIFTQKFSKHQFVSHLYQIIRIASDTGAKIIHSHHRYLDLLGSVAAKFSGLHSIMTCHSIVYGKKILSYRSELIIAVSKAVSASLTGYFGVDASRIKLLHNGIDPSLYGLINESEGEGSRTVIGFAGRLTRAKGFDIFLSICERIIGSQINARFIIAGDGELASCASELAEKYPTVVSYRGLVRNIESVYREIGILLAPSETDSFPYVILEAGLFSLAVIASSVGGMNEIIEDGLSGRLVKDRTADKFFKELLDLLNNPGRVANWARNLQNTVYGHYLISHHIERLETIYGELLEK